MKVPRGPRNGPARPGQGPGPLVGLDGADWQDFDPNGGTAATDDDPIERWATSAAQAYPGFTTEHEDQMNNGQDP